MCCGIRHLNGFQANHNTLLAQGFTQFQANHNILLAQSYPYDNYLAATPYDLGPQAYLRANVSTPGMAPYAATPYDSPFQAYPPANVSTPGMASYATMPFNVPLQAYPSANPSANNFTPGLAPYPTPHELGPPFAQDHDFPTMTTPLAYPTLTNNRNPEHSTNSTTAGKNKVSKPRSLCATCGRDFSRTSDMQRHAKKHRVSKYFQCTVEGCKYAGSYRKDKLDQHVRNVH